MISQLLNLGPRRLFALALVLAGVLLAVLLIILWQAGIFDSAPPPATIESAVESVREEQQSQQQTEAEQSQTEEQAGQAAAQQDEPAQSAAAQEQQGASTSDAEPEQAEAGQQESVATEDSQEQSEEAQPAQDSQPAEEQQASQQSQDAQVQQQQTQQAGQETDQQAEQEVMVPEAPELSDLAGSWVLSSQGTSFVGYRIGEELANIGTTTAVGRTSDVVVALEFDGSAITSVTIEADLRTLTSDQSFRDGALRTRGIETDTYPFATFVLTEAIPIDSLPTAEEALSVTVRGTLELHGVTNPVTIALEGQYVDGLVVVVGATDIALADYDIEPPTGFRVLSIDDVGVMEFQLVLERAP